MICWRIYESLSLSELNDPNIGGIVGKYSNILRSDPLQDFRLAVIYIVVSYIVIWIMEIVVKKVIQVT